LSKQIGLSRARAFRSLQRWRNPFRYFNSSPEIIRLTVMMYVRYPLSLRQVEDLLFERGIDICHETVRLWWHRFGPMFAAEIRKRVFTIDHTRAGAGMDEVFVRIDGKVHYLWRAVDHEGEVLEVFATKRRDRGAALKFLKRALKRYGRPGSIVTDRLRSYGAAMKAIGIVGRRECGRWLNNRSCREVGGNWAARAPMRHGGLDQAARSRSVGERSRVCQPSTRRMVI
jgi:putative transposase